MFDISMFVTLHIFAERNLTDAVEKMVEEKVEMCYNIVSINIMQEV